MNPKKEETIEKKEVPVEASAAKQFEIREGTSQVTEINERGAVQPREKPVYEYSVDGQKISEDNIDSGIKQVYHYGYKRALTPDQKALRQRRVEDLRERDSTEIVCRFINHEMKAGTATFVFRKYKQDPIRTYEFRDGGIYKISLGVMDHVNNTCKYREHQYNEQLSSPGENIYGITSGGRQPKNVQLKKPDYTMVTTPRYEFIPVALRSMPRY